MNDAPSNGDVTGGTEPSGAPPGRPSAGDGAAPEKRSHLLRRRLLPLGVGVSVAVVAADKALLDGAIFRGAGWNAFVWGLCAVGLGIGLFARFGGRLRERWNGRSGREES